MIVTSASGSRAAVEQRLDVGAESGGAPRRSAIGSRRRSSYRARAGAMTPSRPPARSTTRSSSPTSTARPAGRRARSPRGPSAAEQRGPAAEVGPADVHRAHHDLAVAGRALHDRVVDRDRRRSGRRRCRARAREPTVGRSASGAGRCSCSSAARIARRRHRNIPAFQATPGSPSSSRARALGRLLLEAPERVGAQAVRSSAAGSSVRDEVAVLGRRAVDLDAERHQRVLDVEGAGRRGPSAAVRRTSRKTRPRSIDPWSAGRTTMTSSSGAVDGERGERDRRRRVAADRLDDQLDVRDLVADEWP